MRKTKLFKVIIRGNFTSYMGKVFVPCKKCNNLVKLGLFEKIDVCPFCNAKWDGEK